MTSPEILEFFVAGEPTTKGSTRSFYVKKTDRVVTTSTNPKLKAWEARVAYSAMEAANAQGWLPERWPAYYIVSINFFLSRPAAPKYVTEPARKPDLDKLIRAILDGLTGIAYADDAQVIGIRSYKHFFDTLTPLHGSPGASIRIQKGMMKPQTKLK